MEYSEALDIVARSRTQFQAFEQLDEVLKKASGAENHVKELEQRRDDLQEEIKYNQEKLDEIKQSVNATAADYEARLSQLKKAESAAIQGKDKAEAELKKTLMENAKQYQKQSAQADAEARKTKREFDQEIEAKHQELADVEQKINKMKELARSMA
jgi:chromosome segregation ATPase